MRARTRAKVHDGYVRRAAIRGGTPTCARMAQSDDLHTVPVCYGITHSLWQHAHLQKLPADETIHGHMCELEVTDEWSWNMGTEGRRKEGDNGALSGTRRARDSAVRKRRVRVCACLYELNVGGLLSGGGGWVTGCGGVSPTRRRFGFG